MKNAALVGIGGFAVQRYPNSAWSSADVNLNDLWQLCGPTVDHHLRREWPLWKVFCAVYYEGLAHGVQGVMKIDDRPAQSTEWSD